MSVRGELRAGDTSEFALRIGFSPDPDAGESIDPEVGISWGSFQIWVEGRNLCAHNEDGSHVDSVHWYLLPLMEWLVRNWDPLLHEERFPVPNEHDTGWESLRATRFPPPAIENDDERAAAWESKWQSWWTRHALCSAREGGLFPDVILRRLRDSIEISWGPARSAGMPDHFSFLESVPGVSMLEPSKVADPLHQVLSDAGGYLLSLAPESPRIKALVGSLRELNSEESDRRLMWLAGLGTDEETVRTGWDRAKTILSELGDAANSVLSSSAPSPLVVAGSCEAALMFGSLSPDVGRQDIVPLAQTMVDLSSSDGDSETVAQICRSVGISTLGSPSWGQGYELAEELHEQLAMEFTQGDFVDIHEILNRLKIEIISLELSDADIRGVSIAGPHHRPGIVINERNDHNKHDFGLRFTLAHELCHVLFDRRTEHHLALASGPWAPPGIEQRANAFAAMLLMPPLLVQREISRLAVPIDTAAGVQEAARTLRAGVWSVLSHLKNAGFITGAEHERIANEMFSRFDRR